MYRFDDRRQFIDHWPGCGSWSILVSCSICFTCLVLTGCQQLSRPVGLSRSLEELAGNAMPVVEAEALLDLRDGKEQLDAKWKLKQGQDYRWNTKGLTNVLASDEATTVLAAVLASTSIEHRTIAAIGRQRLGISSTRILQKGIDSNRVTPATRCAALETLLRSMSPAAKVKELTQLREDWLPRQDGASPVPEEMLIELLTLLGSTKDISPINLESWLRSRSSRVRQVALISASGQETEGQEIVLDTTILDMLEQETHPKVKIEAIRFLGKHAHDSLLGQRQIEVALTDVRYDIRKAAAESLSMFANESARRLLRHRLADSGIGRVEKASLITFVAAAGDSATAFKYANDSNARIREGVAKALRYDQSTVAIEIAEQYLSDDATAVTLALIRSLEHWPLQDAGPFLFSMMRLDRRSTIRNEAGRQIASRLAKSNERLSHRGTNLGRLQSLWESEYGSLDQNWRRLRSSRRQLDALPFHSKQLTKAVGNMFSADAWIRREAARAIAQQANVAELPKSVRQQLVSQLERELDPEIWTLVLQSLSKQESPESTLAAYLAISNDANEVRLAGLNYLDRFRSPKHASVVLTLWNDPDPEVVVRALQVYSTCNGVYDDRLIELKDSRDSRIALAAAIALCRINDPRGAPTVSLLSKHHSPATRKRAIASMGQLADARFVPDVIQAMNDSNSTIRDVAFTTIESLVEDQATVLQARSMAGRNRAAFWRRWHSDQIRRRQ